VFPNEVLLRTVPNSIGYYSKIMGNWTIDPSAFQPAKDDVDGISLFREDFVTQEDLASRSTHPKGVRVVRVRAKECISLHLSLNPTPDPDASPGHMVIPEMLFVKRSAETKIQAQNIKDLAQKLAQIATKNEVYTPPGMSDPVAKPKG
jgi:hypothetical protein